MKSEKSLTVLDSLNLGLQRAFQDDMRAILLGEDILDPYGGAFKVTKGLSTQFPDRVLTTPISEAAIAGIAGGLALRGMHPVAEIMFGDFSTLIADQVINHIAKFSEVYQTDTPVVIRTPMGGRRGYGPTHSQTLEKLFLGIPGLTVLAPSHILGENELGGPGKLLYDAITDFSTPVFFVENKLQYLLKLLTLADLEEFDVRTYDIPGNLRSPITHFAIQSAPKASLTVTAYGYMAHLALEAMHQLAYEHEIFCELLVPTRLAPFELEPLFDSVSRTSKLLAVEEGTLSMGWGAEVLARTSEALGAGLKMTSRLGARESVIPAAPDLESGCLPGVKDIITRVKEMVGK